MQVSGSTTSPAHQHSNVHSPFVLLRLTAYRYGQDHKCHHADRTGRYEGSALGQAKTRLTHTQLGQLSQGTSVCLECNALPGMPHSALDRLPERTHCDMPIWLRGDMTWDFSTAFTSQAHTCQRPSRSDVEYVSTRTLYCTDVTVTATCMCSFRGAV